MYLNPILRISAEPRCLHAYALSQAGAKRLLELVDDPWTAYQSAIDLLIARRIREERVKAFVTEPPLIIQSKRFDSALQPGKGNAWRGLLMDSTIDRIMRSEGMPAENLTWENTQHDPCIWHS